MTAARDDTLLVDLLTGAVAGVVGLWANDRVDWELYDRDSAENKRRLVEARPHGLDPAHHLVHKAARALGRTPPSQPNPAGIATHYAIGVGAAAAYAVLRRRFPAVGFGGGALTGALLWLLQDEGLNTVTGLAGRPSDYPASVHIRGLLAHITFGVVVESILRLRPGRAAL